MELRSKLRRSLLKWESQRGGRTQSKGPAEVPVAREGRHGGAKLTDPVLAKDTLRDILDDMPSVPG